MPAERPESDLAGAIDSEATMHKTLEAKILEERRKRKWWKIRNRLRLKIFEHEDAGKLDKAQALIEKISRQV